ncbi:TMEM175 family protein [Nocardia sp. NPDC088792]|uniref:TMEM175 family protein n=1 Tax=Nocardia sp. NPDC088792 TaxID=3364332 RepID=UPI0037FD29C7
MTSQETSRHAPVDFSAQRMGASADAVLAIAITLLVIEIKRPEGDQLHSTHALAEFLWQEKASFLAFVLAFGVLWSVWRRHHMLIDNVDRLDRASASWHAPLLLFAAFLPFPTAMFGHAPGNELAVCLDALTVAGLFGSEAIVKEFAWRRATLAPGADPAQIRTSADGSAAVAVFFLASAILAWLTPWVWFAWFAAPLAAHFGGKLIARLRPPRRGSPLCSAVKIARRAESVG